MNEHSNDGLCKWLDRSTAWLATMLGAVLLLGVGLNFLNAALRYLAGGSLVWAEEILVYGMIFLIMFGAVVSTATDDHLRMDVVVQLLPPWAGKWVRVFSHVVLVGVCAFLAWHSHTVVALMMRLGQQSVAARIPVWIPHAFLLASFVLCVFWGAVRAVSCALAPVPNAAEKGGA